MGFVTVAVLYNDFSHEIRGNYRDFGKRLADAMNNWSPAPKYDFEDGYFHAGRVVSRDHSTGYQVVVAHHGEGYTIDKAADLPPIVLDRLADCLKRHGWIAKPPPRKRKGASPIAPPDPPAAPTGAPADV